MIKAGICGARNEVTAKLIKILLFHPDVYLMWVHDGEPSIRIDRLYPCLTGDTELKTIDEFWDSDLPDVDVVFISDKQGRAMYDEMQLPDTVKIIDLTGRYNMDESVTYGLSEINRKYIVHDCFKVGIPGAVAHAIELAILPLAKNLMVVSDIIADVKTSQSLNIPGIDSEVKRLVSGVQTSFNSNVNIKIATEFSKDVIFATVTTACKTSIEVLREIYENYFDDHNFTFIIDNNPTVSDVMGTNKCLMHLERVDDKLDITVAIDGLLKGSAGTAVHNMNLLFGLHEKVGLETF